ncbi:MAG: terminase gpA endonuclease subunit [Planctomycetaceae bacterium]
MAGAEVGGDCQPGRRPALQRSAHTHRLFAEHLTAEYRVRTEGRGRTVDEWKLRPERADNHWLDCLVGCAVAASIQGVQLFGTDVKPIRHSSPLKLSDLRKSKQ